MATRSCKDLKVKVKEVKIPHLTKKNKKKLEAWCLDGLFGVRPMKNCSCTGEAGALLAQSASLLPLCLVGYCGKDHDAINEGALHVQRAYLFRPLPRALVSSLQRVASRGDEGTKEAEGL
ncbi:hypothetical protein R1flu_022672 [Riccia fluitans]|uniref:Uncharacterized protein n=1 Tax=Riccia fluitans TaxID=41844 RepID=A0ABD1XPW8_9MARC